MLSCMVPSSSFTLSCPSLEHWEREGISFEGRARGCFVSVKADYQNAVSCLKNVIHLYKIIKLSVLRQNLICTMYMYLFPLISSWSWPTIKIFELRLAPYFQFSRVRHLSEGSSNSGNGRTRTMSLQNNTGWAPGFALPLVSRGVITWDHVLSRHRKVTMRFVWLWWIYQ